MNKIQQNFRRILQHRFGTVLLATLLLCGISLITRIILLIASATSFNWTIANFFGVFIIGLLFDLAAASFAIIPLVMYLWLTPSGWHATIFNKILLKIYFFIVITTLIFNGISEWFFWEEFSVRYNFIAVDYLIYTTEVIGNIRQSYPITPILIALLLVAGLSTYYLSKWINPATSTPLRFLKRTKTALILLVIPVITYFFVNHKWKNHSANQYANELSGNGMYDFGFAFWNNQLDYVTFYQTLPIEKATKILQENLAIKSTNTTEIGTSKNIIATEKEQKMNVVLISVESLSADFLGRFGNTENITPNLDSIAKKGLLFTKLYASGTRTVRGLEALALSIPPTPGQSIVKRPNNKNLFTLGSVFRSKGYNSRYIYGGYGYFDNMNEFFPQNGYEVTDRHALKPNEITYENTWGVADEDLFNLAMREVDKDYKNNKPFFAQIMTVSNHRPFTYPEGRIDIPSHTGRAGAVKYTDYAIGKFIKDASSKPWFNNTLFVIVSDHCASSAGKVELPIDKYHIPMIFYAPGKINPGNFDKLTAQIDIAPTILGYLNFSYQSKFFGQDVFKMDEKDQRIFISTYQSLGYLKHDKMVILNPNKKVNTFIPDYMTGNSVATKNEAWLTEEAIANYQISSELYKNKGYQFSLKN